MYEYKQTGKKNSGFVKKRIGIHYELQPEGIDIGKITFQSSPQTKTFYPNFVGAVVHKGNTIRYYNISCPIIIITNIMVIGTRNTGVSGHYLSLVRANSSSQKHYHVISDDSINPNTFLDSGKRVPTNKKNDLKKNVDPLSANDLKDPESRYSRDSYLLFYE